MDIQDAVGALNNTDTAIVTTTELVCVTSPLARTRRNSGIVLIAAYANIATGTATTHITPRIRRGTTITDTLVTDDTAVTIGAPVGSNEQFLLIAFEQLNAEQVVQYVFTVQQTAATGNGTKGAAGIFVIIV